MYIHTTTGVACTNLIGDVHSYGMVWYHTNGITNNLSLSQVKDQHPVTYDSRARNAFVVHKPDGSTRLFCQSDRGLYYHDTSLQEDKQNNHDNNGMVLVLTVASNASSYSSADYAHTVLARKVQKIIGCPST